MLLCILMWESLSGLNEKATLSTSYTRKKCRAKLLSCRLRVIYSVEIFPHSLQTLVYIFFLSRKTASTPSRDFYIIALAKGFPFFGGRVWMALFDGEIKMNNQRHFLILSNFIVDGIFGMWHERKTCDTKNSKIFWVETQSPQNFPIYENGK